MDCMLALKLIFYDDLSFHRYLVVIVVLTPLAWSAQPGLVKPIFSMDRQ